MGLSPMKERWMREKFEIVRMFWYDTDVADQVSAVVNGYTRPYMGSDRQRLAINVWEIVWQLSTIMREILRA